MSDVNLKNFIVKLMFLTGIKRKSAKKYIIKELAKPKVLNSDKIRTIGVLVDATVFECFPYLDELSEVFQIDKNNIEVLYYLPNKKEAKFFEERVYSNSTLGFGGRIKSVDANNFIDTEFDSLINFYDEDKLLLNLVSVSSKAKFKIGFSSINNKINDFSVATAVSNITDFTLELKKYLIILKKI